MLKLLRLLSGRLDALDSAFSRFWIRQGRLFNDQFPEGLAAGDLLAANYTRQERDILRTEIDQVRAQLSAMTQPTASKISNGRGLVVPAYFPATRNFPPKITQNNTPQVSVRLSRISPRWLGFSARAGPKIPATQNQDIRPAGVIDTNTGALLHAYKIAQMHMASAVDPRPRADAEVRVSALSTARIGGYWFIENQKDSGHGNRNSPSGVCERERQACRHLPRLTLPVTHGCVTPESMDGRASLHPAPITSPNVPLASQDVAKHSASRPVSGPSPCTKVQDDSRKSGDISTAKYILCEAGL
ncbi:hypothetical protein [Halothiobacillus diazotrophicus]|uniref:hypothetical protein n=1 Tax=Halothiobacillus diazotrophicus TaxID=1860122 RepID=UPI0012E95CA3|nr:hypothetical protein [Halothiobacillus diazotrophicus]